MGTKSNVLSHCISKIIRTIWIVFLTKQLEIPCHFETSPKFRPLQDSAWNDTSLSQGFPRSLLRPMDVRSRTYISAWNDTSPSQSFPRSLLRPMDVRSRTYISAWNDTSPSQSFPRSLLRPKDAFMEMQSLVVLGWTFT